MAAAGRRSGRGGGRGGTRGAAHLSHRARLRGVAIAVMRSRDLRTTFPAGALRGLLGRRAGREPTAGPVRDLRDLHWISIDNDDSRDLDQLSWAERLPGGWDRVLVAVADVDRYVPKGSPLDLHAEANTTSVYMPGNVFPMLPDERSHDLTSLNPGEDRHAIVVEFSVDAAGQVRDGEIFRAQVHNRAQLAYDAVSEWLVAHGDPPPAADERAPSNSSPCRTRSPGGWRRSAPGSGHSTSRGSRSSTSSRRSVSASFACSGRTGRACSSRT